MLNFNEINKRALDFSNQQVPVMRKFADLLQGFGIKNFHYVRHYYDGRFLHLVDNKDLNEFYFDKVAQPTPQLINIIYSCYTDNMWPKENLDILFQWLKEHNMANGYAISICREEYYEAWSFGSNTENNNACKAYSIFRPDLLRFIKYFHMQATDILHKSTESLGHFKNFKMEQKPLPKIDHYDGVNIPWVHCNSLVYLTEQQQKCFLLLNRGYDIKTISHFLKIAPRTTETHLIKVKEKFGVKFKSELVQIYNDNISLNV